MKLIIRWYQHALSIIWDTYKLVQAESRGLKLFVSCPVTTIWYIYLSLQTVTILVHHMLTYSAHAPGVKTAEWIQWNSHTVSALMSSFTKIIFLPRVSHEVCSKLTRLQLKDWNGGWYWPTICSSAKDASSGIARSPSSLQADRSEALLICSVIGTSLIGWETQKSATMNQWSVENVLYLPLISLNTASHTIYSYDAHDDSQ